MARLGDVATYINGYAFKPEDWSQTGVPIIRIQDLTGNSYQANRYNGEYEQKYEVNDGDVLISWSASLGVYVWHGEKAVLNQHIFKVVFDKVEVSKSFFVHQVENILERASSSTHGATMKHLTKPVFDALPFFLPPLTEQCKIAAVLDKISDLIAKRRRQLDKLDELVKSRFVEMFGTIDVNKYKFEVVTLEEASEQITDGTHQTPIYTKDMLNGYKFLSSRDVVSGMIDWENVKYIPEILHKELYSHLAPRKGDILLAKNGTTGIAAVVDCDEVFDIYVSLALIRPKTTIEPVYLWAAINSIETKRQFDANLKGIGVPNLHLKEIRKARVILPPQELQRKFVAFVEKNHSIKLTIQRSLTTLDMLKKSLMQEYFSVR